MSLLSPMGRRLLVLVACGVVLLLLGMALEHRAVPGKAGWVPSAFAQHAALPATPLVNAAVHGVSLVATPIMQDRDGDGLTDDDEIGFGTDPDAIDTDGDGIDDAAELLGMGTNPLVVDTDGDGLSDGTETTGVGTDPLRADTDGDGVSDAQEIGQGTDPLDPSSS